MCHAALGKGVERKNGKRLWHGPEFRALEARHPKSAELDGWIKSGGWRRAVRSDRSRNTALKRWGQSKVKR
jgi:hypothetical protein